MSYSDQYEYNNHLTDCSGIEYNRTYHLCNTDNNAATDTGVSSKKDTLTDSSTPEITMATDKSNGDKEESNTKSEDPHTPTVCTPPTVTNNVKDRKMECSDMVSIRTMGAVIGIFVVLLVVMTSGYIYICWNNMKKRGGLRIISKQMTR